MNQMTIRRRYAVTLAVCTPLVLLPAAVVSYAAAPDSPVTTPALARPTASSLASSPAPNLPPLPVNSSDPAAFLIQLGIPSCESEDPPLDVQPVCVWNARTQGNHLGHSVLLFHDQVIDLG